MKRFLTVLLLSLFAMLTGASVAQAATQTPVPSVGIDQKISVGTTYTRTAAVISYAGPVTSQSWTVITGPAFGDVGRVLSTTRSVSYKPPIVGTYVLEYKATNVAGVGTDRVSITVVPVPAPAVTQPVPESKYVCVPFGSGLRCTLRS